MGYKGQQSFGSAERTMSKAQATPSITLRGRLAPAPLGRLGRGLVYGSGLFLLRPLLSLLHRLLGWRREARLTLAAGQVQVVTEVFLLGQLLHTEQETLPASRLQSAATVTARALEPVALGALAVTVSLVWGLVQLVDGLYGRSFGLVALGLGAIASGVVVDLLILWVARVLPDPARHGLALRTVDGRLLSLRDVVPETAARFAEGVTDALA
jgi:hypothetical protein